MYAKAIMIMKITDFHPFVSLRKITGRESCGNQWGRLWWHVYLAECQRAMPGWLIGWLADWLTAEKWAPVHCWIPTWSLTGKAPEKFPGPQRKGSSSNRLFSGGELSNFRGVCGCKSQTLHWLTHNWCDFCRVYLGFCFTLTTTTAAPYCRTFP